MLTGLPFLTSALWITVALVQIAVAIVVTRSRMQSRYPWFCSFIYFSAVKSPALMAIRSHPAPYFWTYYIASLVTSLLLCAVLYEIYSFVFGPRRGLPAWTPRNVVAMIVSGIAIATLLAVIIRPRFHNQFASGVVVANTALDAALWISLVILLLYSRWMRIGCFPVMPSLELLNF